MWQKVEALSLRVPGNNLQKSYDSHIVMNLRFNDSLFKSPFLSFFLGGGGSRQSVSGAL